MTLSLPQALYAIGSLLVALPLALLAHYKWNATYAFKPTLPTTTQWHWAMASTSADDGPALRPYS